MSAKAYNVVATPLTAANVGTNANSKAKITFRASMTVGGKLIERTIVAQGAAAALVDGKIEVGTPIALRCLFERAPSNDEGQRGGEFLTVVALPRERQAA